MEYVELGQTKISVSRLCFGTLTLGPLQRNLSVKEGASILRYAIEQGVNFLDTAKLYATYPYIKEALKGWQGDVCISTKSYAFTKKGVLADLEEARRALNRDRIALFLLHEQESEHTLKGHYEAIEGLLEAKEQGQILALGLSTHFVQGVRAVLQFPEIEVVSPLLNEKGIGIQGGTRQEMEEAIEEIAKRGRGVYAMKPLGGGHLLNSYAESLRYILSNPWIHSVAIGMKSKEEVDSNLQYVSQGIGPERLPLNRRLHIESWCTGCGSCVTHCSLKALQLVDQKVAVDASRCVFCGYCGGYCPEFAIKVI